MTPSEAFFTVHRDLPREGPGLPEHVHWVLDTLSASPTHVLDAASGPGEDTVTLAEALPEANILAIDLHGPFVAQVRQRTAKFGARVHAEEVSYLEVDGSFDLIWCAGAVYFVGIEKALEAWKRKLDPGGAVAFSEPAWKSATPSDAAKAFWAEYPAITNVEELSARIDAAGWSILGNRWLGEDAWEAYYAPLAERLDTLQSQGNVEQALEAAIDENRKEVADWQAAKDEIDYHLFVVRPA